MDEQDIGWRNGRCWWGFWLGTLVPKMSATWALPEVTLR
jgi:hypothetical protein